MLETQVSIGAYRVLEMLEPPSEDAGTGDYLCYDRRRPRRRQVLQPTSKNAGTGDGDYYNRRRILLRQRATTGEDGDDDFLLCWNQLSVYWNRRPNLLRRQATTGEDGDGDFLFFAGASLFCWNQLFVLLERASQGAGTGEPLCPPPPEPDNPVLFVHCTRFLFYNAKTKLVLFA